MKPCRTARPWPGSTRVLVLLMCATPYLHAQASIDVAKMRRIGAVDERFQSYNIEMVEIVGGRFWKPYGGQAMDSRKSNSATEQTTTPAGMDPSLYQYRPPIDLSNSRLRNLAAALGPAYVRVSGTWANTVYFQNSDGTAVDKAPAGFSGVLTRKEWKGVIDFSHAADADVVTSFATSSGTRDAKGVWTPEQAGQLFAYTKSLAGQIAAAEFMNEPTYAAMGGAPKGYGAASYGRDIAVFRPFLKRTSPTTIFLGPGSVGEGPFAMPMGSGVLNSTDLMIATGQVFDVFSYHLYAAASQRCASLGAGSQTTESAALSEEWLSRPEKIGAFYASLRDKFEPGKDLWITETADAACGGNPWASTFLDTFRYLVQHGILAQRGVRVIMHNTLASSDYGLLDENTFEPRPNYWAALLWRKLMGTTVLDPHLTATTNVYVYAHCLENRPGGVALLIVNADQQRDYKAILPIASQRYSLTAKEIQDTTIQLNGKSLGLDSNDALPQLSAEPTSAGRVTFAPTSITFLSFPNAANSNCP
jgi:heparanase 1